MQRKKLLSRKQSALAGLRSVWIRSYEIPEDSDYGFWWYHKNGLEAFCRIDGPLLPAHNRIKSLPGIPQHVVDRIRVPVALPKQDQPPVGRAIWTYSFKEFLAKLEEQPYIIMRIPFTFPASELVYIYEHMRQQFVCLPTIRMTNNQDITSYVNEALGKAARLKTAEEKSAYLRAKLAKPNLFVDAYPSHKHWTEPARRARISEKTIDMPKHGQPRVSSKVHAWIRSQWKALRIATPEISERMLLKTLYDLYEVQRKAREDHPGEEWPVLPTTSLRILAQSRLR